ncbi:unnamed protein product, partial [Scytosiphon promiscuus]
GRTSDRGTRGSEAIRVSPLSGSRPRACCRFLGGALLLWGSGGPTSTTTLFAAASSAAASSGGRRTRTTTQRRSDTVALLQAGSAGRGFGLVGGGEAGGARSAWGVGPAPDGARRPTTQLRGYTIKVRDGGGKRDWDAGRGEGSRGGQGRREGTEKGFGKRSAFHKSKLDHN